MPANDNGLRSRVWAVDDRSRCEAGCQRRDCTGKRWIHPPAAAGGEPDVTLICLHEFCAVLPRQQAVFTYGMQRGPAADLLLIRRQRV